MPDDDNVTSNVSIWDNEGNKNVTVTTDGAKERLDVNATFSENPFPGSSVSEFLVDGSSNDMTVDGSVTPVEFTVVPNTGKILYVFSITIVIEDTSINFDKYGGVPALTNGVDYKIKENGEAEFTAANIKRNGDYYAFVNELILDSSTTDILVGKVLIQVNNGTTIKLTDSNSEYIKTVVNDDLTSINKHFVLVRGYEVDE